MHSDKSSWKYSRLAFIIIEKKRADRKRDFKKIERKTGNFLRVFQTSIVDVKKDFRMFRKDDMAIIQTWTRACEIMYVKTAYKRKNQKVKPVNLKKSNDFKPKKNVN